MNNSISPKYLMTLVSNIKEILQSSFSLKEIEFYIEKWHESYQNGWRDEDYEENFAIYKNNDGDIDLIKTLHSMNSEMLLKIAIDLCIETPDFIPLIPTFKNEIKTNYKTAYATFEKAFKEIEAEPSLAIGLANSALESIIKEILKNKEINSKIKGKETLYDLTQEILKIFKTYPNSDMPEEIKTLGSSLLAISQSIEKLRSEKTHVHGKTAEDYIINDSLYAYFIVNSVATVGFFLNSYYMKKFPKNEEENHPTSEDEMPF